MDNEVKRGYIQNGVFRFAAIPDCDRPGDEPKEFCVGCEVCGSFDCSYCVIDDSSSDPVFDPETGKPAVFSMADVIGCTLGGQLRSADGSMTVDASTGTIIIRGSQHSLNDGLRDTRWRRADRAVKRWFCGAARYLKVCFYCGIDEVGHFVLKVLGAGLTLYAVAAVALHFYG